MGGCPAAHNEDGIVFSGVVKSKAYSSHFPWRDVTKEGFQFVIFQGRTLPNQHGLILLPGHLSKMGQTKDIAVFKDRFFANGLQESTARKILQVVAEEQMVGRFTG
jgi:hypothetical protein